MDLLSKTPVNHYKFNGSSVIAQRFNNWAELALEQVQILGYLKFILVKLCATSFDVIKNELELELSEY